MIGRVATFQVKNGNIDDATEAATKAIGVVAERTLTGYEGYLKTVERVTGKFLTLQRWSTEPDTAALTSGPLFRERMGAPTPLFTRSPTWATYDVAVCA